MRYAVAIAVLWTLLGCANPNVMQEAADRCAAVGISQHDADFLACTQAYRLDTLQTSISNSYRNAVDSVPRRRRAND